jgi:putative ABC transport system substrate-binding protein
MGDLGYSEGQNLVTLQHYAEGSDELAAPAAALVRLDPEVIVVPGIPAVRAVLAASTVIPIVSAGAGNSLVNAGLVASHARPGGVVTGLSTSSLVGKQLQLLQEVVPSLSRVAVLFDATSPEFRSLRREPYEAAARTLGLTVVFVGTGGAADLEAAIAGATGEHADGLFVTTGPALLANQSRIADLATLSRLPSMWQQSEAVRGGGLLGYGHNRVEGYRRAAYFVDRILKGTPPAELPIEEPMRFDFIINLRTAQALSLTIPQHVLLQATEIIQ